MGVMPQQLFSLHRGVFRSGVGNLSPELWYSALGNALPADGRMAGVLMGDDFSNFFGWGPAISGATAIPSTTVPSSGYAFYTDTATSTSTISPKASAINTARFSVGATDNHEAWMQSGSGVAGNCKFSTGVVAFEAIFSVAQIAANGGAVFLGLGQPGMAVANTKVDDTGVLVASKSLIGFDTQQDAPSSLDIVYQDSAGSLQTVKSAAATLVADTLVNAGFIYDPRCKPSQRIKFFIDNEDVKSYVSDDQVNAAAFPLSDILSFVAGIKTGAASAAHLDLKAWQLFYAY